MVETKDSDKDTDQSFFRPETCEERLFRISQLKGEVRLPLKTEGFGNFHFPERIVRLSKMAPPSRTAADIGCDHAYTSILLAGSGKAKRVIAADLRREPLRKAEENIRKFGFSDRIETRLGDGLSVLKPGEADLVVLSGIGGELLIRILDGHLQEFSSFLLSPQSDLYKVREFLLLNGMRFLDEDMVEEDGKFYTLMLVSGKKNMLETGSEDLNRTALTSGMMEAALRYGPVLLKKQPETLYQFLLTEKTRCEGILSGTESEKVRREYTDCISALRYFKGHLS